MNATLKQMRGFGKMRRDGLNEQTSEIGGAICTQQDATVGSYGRGIYAGHATYTQDYCSQGSYGRGVYSGRSTARQDFATQGSFASVD